MLSVISSVNLAEILAAVLKYVANLPVV